MSPFNSLKETSTYTPTTPYQANSGVKFFYNNEFRCTFFTYDFVQLVIELRELRNFLHNLLPHKEGSVERRKVF